MSANGKARQEQFGDPLLVNRALAPTPADRRVLRSADLLALWVALALTPPTYAFAIGLLPPAPLMSALAGALVVATVVAMVLSRTAARYGVGLVPVSRAAFGPRGAIVPSLLRAAAGICLSSLWAWQLGRWLVALLVAATGWPLSSPKIPGTSYGVLAWTLAVMLLFVAYLLASLGPVRLHRTAAVIELGTLGLGVGLVVFAGIASKGFGPWLGRNTSFERGDLVNAGVLWLSVAMPVLLSAPEWARFSPRPYPGGRTSGSRHSVVGMAPFTMVPAGLALAFVGVLFAAASFVGRSRIDAMPIPDAAGFGGLAAGYAAALLACGVFLAAAPMVGLYAPAVSLSSLSPRSLRLSRSLPGVTGLSMLLCPAVIYGEETVHAATWMALALGPPAAVLVVDELLVRRGRLLLEEVYLLRSHYSTVAGVTFSAFLAVCGGWLLHPAIFPLIAQRLSSPLVRLIEKRLQPEPMIFGWVFGVAVAAGIYLLFAPLERALVRWIRHRPHRRRVSKRLGRRRKETLESSGAAAAKDSSDSDGLVGKGWD